MRRSGISLNGATIVSVMVGSQKLKTPWSNEVSNEGKLGCHEGYTTYSFDEIVKTYQTWREKKSK